MIEIIEKEPYKSYDSWNERYCLMYPVIMIKNGVEHFIFYRREPQESYEDQKDKKILSQLKENDGMYVTFYSPYSQPIEFLKNIIENRYSFDETFTEFIECKQRNFVVFHGNLNEISSAFRYRIFDKELEDDLREIVTLINNKEWYKAEIEVQEKRKKYNNKELEIGKINENEELEQ